MQLTEDYSRMDLSSLDPDDRKLIEDTIRAQSLYRRLQKVEDVKLLRPSILQRCADVEKLRSNINNFSARKFPSLTTLEDTEVKCECGQLFEQAMCCDSEIDYKCDCDECECKENTKLFISTLCEKCEAKGQHKNAKNIVTGFVIIGCSEVVPVIGGTFREKICDCMQKYQNNLIAMSARNWIQCQRAKFVINGVVMTRLGPIYCMTTAVLNSRLRRLFAVQNEQIQDTAENTDKIQQIKDVTEKACDIPPGCTCQNDKTKTDPIKKTRSAKKHTKAQCEHCCEYSTSTVSLCCYSSEASSDHACKCKMELQKHLKEKCTCEQCIMEARQANATYIIAGTQQLPEEAPVRIIEGVKDYRCNCLEKYLEKMRKLEDYRQRANARYELKSQNVKYAISGVATTSEGPAYIIAGIRQPVQCVCAQVQREKEESEKQLRRMPKPAFKSLVTYNIAGVAEGPDENIYILNQVLQPGTCACEQLYQQYGIGHKTCLESFQEFLNQMELDMEQYEVDMGVKLKRLEAFKSTSDSSVQSYRENKSESSFDDKIATENTRQVKPENIETIQTEIKEELSSEPTKEASAGNINSQTTECTCKCTAMKSDESVVFDPNFAIKLSVSSCAITSDQLENKPEASRFIILKKIPCDEKKQMKILKEVLAGMALDGFPLAKLPDSYKLPHFKLWMQFRCGKKWNRRDRDSYQAFSRLAWDNIELSYKKVPDVKLGISKAKLKKMTWASANFWREYVRDRCVNFQRQVKQDLVEKAREFFPTTYSYEFPTPTFRDCYFAYNASKEEDLVIG